MRASPDEWGETLEGEQLRGGSFLEQDQIQVGDGDGDGVMRCVVLCTFIDFCFSRSFLSLLLLSYFLTLLLSFTPSSYLSLSLAPSLPPSLPHFPHHIASHHTTSHRTTQSEPWQRLLELEVGNCRHRLFGGAQYHRAIREFTVNHTVDYASYLRLIYSTLCHQFNF